MKTYKLICFLLFVFSSNLIFAQSAIGFWRTYDDETGKNKAVIEIFEKNGSLFGKIVETFVHSIDTPCSVCPGDRKDHIVGGLEVIRDMKSAEENSWDGGTILDPESGKVYKCSMSLTDSTTLKVRGYIGFSFIGRNQIWKRK